MFFKRKSKAPHDPLPELAVEFRREYSFGLFNDDVLEYAESAPIGLTADYINSLTEYRERTTLDTLSAEIYAENKAVVATILNGGV